MLVRFGPPTKYDHAPYKTICKIVKNNDTCDVYVQLSQNEEVPFWDFVGAFEFISDDDITKKVFLDKKL